MTPQQALNRLVRIAMSTNNREGFRSLFEKVAATAKATETRRCAARAKETLSASTDEELGRLIANDILTTGGLEAEE